MRNNLSDHRAPQTEFNGHYRGVVINRDDPKQAGRLQIKVYPMFEGVQDDALPWAIPADPFMGGFGDVGGLFIPEEKAHVWVFFEGGDPRFPVYFAGAPAISGGVPDQPKEGRTGYPYKKVYKTRQGVILEIDDTPGAETIKITHPAGYTSEIDSKGGKTENIEDDSNTTVKGKYQLIIDGDAAVQVGGSADIEASGEVTVKGSQVNINP